MSDIVLSNISVSFGEKTVLKDFSYIFSEHTITCITGGSGRGKTTLLNVIAGLMKPDTGSVEGVPERIAFVFQEDRLAENFSALSNIRLVSGKTFDKERAKEILQRLGLKEAASKKVSQYSGGMKRRVALARALYYDADIVLLDEPFKGLDGDLKKTTMDTVLEYTKNATVICVTHDEYEAGYLGKNILNIG